MLKRPPVLLLITLALVSSQSCVYYNTFHNAELAAEEAAALREERPPGSEPGAQEIELYERAIEKSGVVLRKHADTSWADDAYLLIGSSLYYQGKYESAEAKLTEFLAVHPNSELRPEAEYMLAAVMVAKGNTISAESLLEDLANADPPHDLSDDALFLIGEGLKERELYEEAAAVYTEALERFPDSDRAAEIHFSAAECYLALERYLDSARHYAAVADEDAVGQLLFEARLKLSEVKLTPGDIEEGLVILDDLERRTTDQDNLDRILLLKARGYEELGDLEKAISTYEGVSVGHPRSDASAAAHYRIGLLHRDRLESLDEALASFEKAREEAPRSDAGELATQAARDVEAMKRYMATIERGTAVAATAAVGEAASEGEGNAEPGVTEGTGEDPGAVADSSGAATSIVDTAHVTALPPPTGEGVEIGPPDSLAAAGVDSLPGMDGPGGQQGGEPGRSDPAPTERQPDARAEPRATGPTDEEVADAYFHLGEIYLFRIENVDKALARYKSVVEDYPTSEVAPRAGLAVAWALETAVGDTAAALIWYRRVIGRFPRTEQANAARERLGIETIPLVGPPMTGLGVESAATKAAAVEAVATGGPPSAGPPVEADAEGGTEGAVGGDVEDGVEGDVEGGVEGGVEDRVEGDIDGADADAAPESLEPAVEQAPPDSADQNNAPGVEPGQDEAPAQSP